MARIRLSTTSRPASVLYSSAMGAFCTLSRIGFRRANAVARFASKRFQYEVEIGMPQRFHMDVVVRW